MITKSEESDSKSFKEKIIVSCDHCGNESNQFVGYEWDFSVEAPEKDIFSAVCDELPDWAHFPPFPGVLEPKNFCCIDCAKKFFKNEVSSAKYRLEMLQMIAKSVSETK